MALALTFEIRNATKDDMACINSYCLSEDMSEIASPDNIYVATDGTEPILGFIRIRIADDGRAFVNPIITSAGCRGRGVGKALMEYARAHHGDLYLVARGKATGFYRKIGLTDISWDEIIFDLTEDCENCSIIAECHPQPMKFSHVDK